MTQSTKMITMGQLKKGDIILSTTSAPVSKVVKFATDSKFSHARLYLGGEYIMEAIDPNVRREKLVTVLKEDLYAVVYRMPNLTETQTTKIVQYALKQDAKEYDLSGAIGSSGVGRFAVGVIPTIDNYLDPEYDFYCSELIAFSFQNAGVKFNKHSSQVTPEDLASSKNLIYVGHLKMSGM